MEKTISTDVNSNVIIFHDGSKVFISEKQAAAILQQKTSLAKDISISGQIYAFSSMAKVITLGQFYDQYPDERPEARTEYQIEDDRYKGLSVEQIAELDQKRFSGVLKGLKQFIDEEMSAGRKPLNAIKIYKEKLFRYKQKFVPSGSKTG